MTQTSETQREGRLLRNVLFTFFVSGAASQPLGSFIPFLRDTYGFSYDLSGVLLSDVGWPAVYLVGGLAAAFALSPVLNIMALGDDSAHNLGLRVGAWRMGLLALAAVLAGAAVSFAGLLGFVGLIIPHLVRFFVGYDNRWVLPLSAVTGAVFVVLCDMLARVLFAPYEVPVGILMAFLGGPFFIYLILRNRRGGLD